ncbi:MAG: hypothetical protein ABSG01_09010 [Anaerolineales bacterium]|jgi:hypothetical protein
MPARKSKDLIVRHEIKADRTQRAEHEAALTPRKPLTVKAPAELTGAISQAVWKETVSLYFTLDARIVSILDKGLLIDYCIASEQLAQIDGLRSTAMDNYNKDQITLNKIYNSKKQDIDVKALLLLINSVNGAMDEIIKLDARVDAKRKMILAMRQSLYLTPRARAGAIPNEKPAEKPKSATDLLIDGHARTEKGN